jgi:YfiH family protein
MRIHQNLLFRIFFGDAAHAYVPYAYQGFAALDKAPFALLREPLLLQQLVFLKQIHSDRGMVVTHIDAQQELPSFVQEGDFLITNVPHIGIGISTADCLPVIAYDRKHHALGIAHAGWRGSVVGIALKMLERMRLEYGTVAHEVAIFFGPSAQPCCYTVGAEFKKNIQGFSFVDQVLTDNDQGFIFDLSLFNQLQLQAYGVPVHAFTKAYQHCTICTKDFCSVRRMPATQQRHMTVVALNA